MMLQYDLGTMKSIAAGKKTTIYVELEDAAV